jgi:transcriptional regulator
MSGVYVPPQFTVDDDDAWRIVTDAGAGVLVIATNEGLRSVFVPVVVSADRRTLTSHVARANSWWRAVAPDTEVLALFLAASAYVSPTYYASRETNPNVVPTWNYVAAEVRGRVSVHDEPGWKLDQVSTLTQRFEAGRDPEWRLEDIDEHYRDKQLGGIVGVEIDVTAIEGKSKLSQNRPEVDQDSVRDHLSRRSLTEQHVAKRME